MGSVTSYVFFSESVHVVPSLIHRTSRDGVLVTRGGWEGNISVFLRTRIARIAPQSGHSTFETPVCVMSSSDRSITPTNEHLADFSSGFVSPTGSRSGVRCPTRSFVVFLGGSARSTTALDEAWSDTADWLGLIIEYHSFQANSTGVHGAPRCSVRAYSET